MRVVFRRIVCTFIFFLSLTCLAYAWAHFQAYDEAVRLVRECDSNAWYQIRTLSYPFTTRIVETLMQLFAILVDSDSRWPSIQLWFSNSELNVKV